MDDYLTKHVYTYGNKMLPYRIKMKECKSEDGFRDLNEWIEKNIKGTWTDVYRGSVYSIFFELEEDAVAFKLRWT